MKRLRRCMPRSHGLRRTTRKACPSLGFNSGRSRSFVALVNAIKGPTFPTRRRLASIAQLSYGWAGPSQRGTDRVQGDSDTQV